MSSLPSKTSFAFSDESMDAGENNASIEVRRSKPKQFQIYVRNHRSNNETSPNKSWMLL